MSVSFWPIQTVQGRLDRPREICFSEEDLAEVRRNFERRPEKQIVHDADEGLAELTHADLAPAKGRHVASCYLVVNPNQPLGHREKILVEEHVLQEDSLVKEALDHHRKFLIRGVIETLLFGTQEPPLLQHAHLLDGQPCGLCELLNAHGWGVEALGLGRVEPTLGNRLHAPATLQAVQSLTAVPPLLEGTFQ